MKIFQRDLSNQQEDVLSSKSLFSEKVTVLQASFLALDGKILDSSKTLKVAKYFGYSLQELKDIKTVKSLMPQILATNHDSFVSSFINKSQNNSHKIISSYALDKSGFIFSSKVYKSKHFSSLNDLIFSSAIMNTSQENEQLLLLDQNGVCQGISGFNADFVVDTERRRKSFPSKGVSRCFQFFLDFRGFGGDLFGVLFWEGGEL